MNQEGSKTTKNQKMKTSKVPKIKVKLSSKLNKFFDDQQEESKRKLAEERTPSRNQELFRKKVLKQLKDKFIEGETPKEKEECSICLTNKPTCIYEPCFHGGMCLTCATKNYTRMGKCYICREVTKSPKK